MAKKNPKRQESSRDELLDRVRGDSKFKRFKKLVLEIREKFNMERDMKEALSLHAGRSSRSLSGSKQYSAKALLEAGLQDASIRSRLVEIRVQITYNTSLLEEAVKKIKRYISTEYAEDLNTCRTVGERTALIDRLVATALDVTGEGKAVQELLDTIVKDIDQAGYTLSNNVKILELLDNSKGRVV